MPLQRILRLAISLALVGVFLLQASGVLNLGFIQDLKNFSYDTRLRWTLPNTVDQRVAIVAIDETSLNRIGQWPWSRDKLAQLVDHLHDRYNASAIGFDVVFAERDEGAGLRTLHRLADTDLASIPAFRRQYRRLEDNLDYDQQFARALKDRNTVLGYFFRNDVTAGTDATHGRLPNSLGQAPHEIDDLGLDQPQGFGANLPVLQKAAAGGGFFNNPLVSADGVFRRVPLVQAYQGRLYGLLALNVVRAQLGWPPVELDIADQDSGYRALEAVRIGDRRVPVDAKGGVLVPYRGRAHSFPYVSAADVLDGSADGDKLEDRIVLVGATAAGLLDLRSTPVQNVYPGVEIHANIISGLLDGDIKHQPAYLVGYEFVLVLLLGLGLTALLPRLNPLWLATATLAVAVALIATNMLAWVTVDLVLPLATPLLLALLLFIFHVAWGFFVETRGKRQLARLFGQYIPPELVEEMDAAPEEVTLAGESREMTALFSDVRGFTNISEGLEASELTRLMNAFLTPMTRVIHQHRGTIDKYMGDAIMAFWGAPLQDPEHARHALHAALDMQHTLAELQPTFAQEGWPDLSIGIGLNTGEMNVGNMGSEFRMAYTALGDAVNLGSRLEGLTRTYGVDIIVSETTRAAAPEFVYRELDRVRVKGKAEPVAIFEPFGLAETVDSDQRKALRRYHAALERYRNRDWDGAEREMFALASEHPRDAVFPLYLDRIMHFRNEPPPDDWDGVFTHEAK